MNNTLTTQLKIVTMLSYAAAIFVSLRMFFEPDWRSLPVAFWLFAVGIAGWKFLVGGAAAGIRHNGEGAASMAILSGFVLGALCGAYKPQINAWWALATPITTTIFLVACLAGYEALLNVIQPQCKRP